MQYKISETTLNIQIFPKTKAGCEERFPELYQEFLKEQNNSGIVFSEFIKRQKMVKELLECVGKKHSITPKQVQDIVNDYENKLSDLLFPGFDKKNFTN